MIKFGDMDKGDKQFLIGSVLAPILIWWYFNGRSKYSVKGMK